jgi:hypothetical protein
MRIDTIEKLLAMLLLQAANLATYKTQVGATATDLAEVGQDAANLQALMDYAAVIEANKKTVNQIKQQLYNGDKDEAISPLPVFPEFSPPFPMVAGALERAQKRNRRFKAAEGYTKEIGIALGIDGDTPGISPDSIKATFEAFPAQMGYKAGLIISNRGKSTMWKARGQRAGSQKWFDLASGTGKAGNIEIEPTTAGQPERLLIMIQLYKDNEPYGQASDPQYVTFNP